MADVRFCFAQTDLKLVLRRHAGRKTGGKAGRYPGRKTGRNGEGRSLGQGRTDA